MKLCFTPSAWEDYLWFQENNRKLLKRINLLIRDTLRSPYEGIGKPEPLKADLAGHWSRRITDEHRPGLHGDGKRADDHRLPVPLLKVITGHP